MLHERLRQTTKGPHHLLDHHPLLAPLVTPTLDTQQYGNALAALHGIHAQAEPMILAFLDQHPGLFDYRSRRKLPALESDLAELGRQPMAAQANFPAPQTVGALIGVIYTIEGSTMGGQVIARTIRQISGNTFPLKFFSGYGDLSRHHWDEFLNFAETRCPPNEYEVATASAMNELVCRYQEAPRCGLPSPVQSIACMLISFYQSMAYAGVEPLGLFARQPPAG
jgi:heme oxygenase